jgi:hypothetical protein
MFEEILGYIRKQIGLRTDTASSTGSAHAKAGYIISYLANSVNAVLQKPRGPVGTAGIFSTSIRTAYQTALSISGKGKLVALSIGLTGGGGITSGVRATVDGYVVAEGHGITPAAAPYLAHPTGAFLVSQTSGTNTIFDAPENGGNQCNCQIEFKSSLVIETKEIAGGSAQVWWQYVTE